MFTARKLVLKTLTLGLLAGLFCVLPAKAQTADFDTRPMPLKTPPPAYPADMKRASITGMVAVAVVIDEGGTVTECSVAKASRTEFEQPAIDAVKHWKFKPALKGGSPVKARMVIPIKFSLDD